MFIRHSASGSLITARHLPQNIPLYEGMYSGLDLDVFAYSNSFYHFYVSAL